MTKKEHDLTASFPGLFIIHQKIRGKTKAPHKHDSQHEIFLPLQGEIHISVDGKEMKAGPGKMIYMPAGLEHAFQSSTAAQGERLIFLIEERTWKAHAGESFGPTLLPAGQLCKEVVFQLLLHPKTRASKALIETLVHVLTEMMQESAVSAQSDLAHLEGRSGDQRVRQALLAIREKFNSNLAMEELARQSGLSVRNLNRLFMSELGMSPKQAVTLYRIDSARRLLKAGELSVTDVALEVGYNSVSQFITTFRKVTGQLPSTLMPLWA